jgi:hypothetical protein
VVQIPVEGDVDRDRNHPVITDGGVARAPSTRFDRLVAVRSQHEPFVVFVSAAGSPGFPVVGIVVVVEVPGFRPVGVAIGTAR